MATIEHSIQILLAALFALWIRNSLAAWYSFFVAFLLLGWITVSWALFFPMFVPPDNVILVTGFYMALFSLLFSGGVAPLTYKGKRHVLHCLLFCGGGLLTRTVSVTLATQLQLFIAVTACLSSLASSRLRGTSLKAWLSRSRDVFRYVCLC